MFGFFVLLSFDLFMEGIVFELLEWNGTTKNDWFFALWWGFVVVWFLYGITMLYTKNKIWLKIYFSVGIKLENLERNSTVSCPNCGFRKIELMELNSCQFFYECSKCKSILKPKEGDCCVFCSYGDVKCPPVQSDSKCC